MKTQMKYLTDELETQITTMGTLAEILIEIGAYKGSDPAPQIDERGEGAIQDAIRIISRAAPGLHHKILQMQAGVKP